jgi:lipopolysaccharide transport system permease protein
MGIVVTVFLFVSPVFYSVESVPPEYRLIIAMNPLTLPIEQLRDAVLWSRPIEWKDWLASLLVGMGVFYSGFVWFQRTRKGFSDVL